MALNEFSARFAEVLFAAFPTLRGHARECSIEDHDSGSLLVEFSPPPVRPDCRFYVCTTNQEVTVGFDRMHTHMQWPAQDAIEFIRDLMAEKIVVAVRMTSGRWAGSTTLREGESPDVSNLSPDDVVYLRSWSGSKDAEFRGSGSGS